MYTYSMFGGVRDLETGIYLPYCSLSGYTVRCYLMKQELLGIIIEG
jgi:hypothetical protein